MLFWLKNNIFFKDRRIILEKQQQQQKDWTSELSS